MKVKQMRKLILTDIDGCCLDWNASFDEYMRTFDVYMQDRTEYALGKRYGVDHEWILKAAKDFNESQAITTLNAHKDAVSGIATLASAGYRFIAVTAVGNSPTTVRYRESNLLSTFGDVFDEVICVQLTSAKVDVLRRWEGSGLLWIEDCHRHAKAGARLGLKSIMVEADYNRLHVDDDVMVVGGETPWAEISKLCM